MSSKATEGYDQKVIIDTNKFEQGGEYKGYLPQRMQEEPIRPDVQFQLGDKVLFVRFGIVATITGYEWSDYCLEGYRLDIGGYAKFNDLIKIGSHRTAMQVYLNLAHDDRLTGW